MEAVIFVGGVSLGQPATSIPIATIVGLICGLVCGTLIYAFASRTSQPNHFYIANWLFTHRFSFNNLLGADDKLHPVNWSRAFYQMRQRPTTI
jgi:hypothetical protein